MTRLTIVAATSLPEINGAAVSLRNLIGALVAKGIDVRAVVPDYTPVRHLLPSAEGQPLAELCRVQTYASSNFGGYSTARKPRPFSLRVRPEGADDRVVVFEPDRLRYGNILHPVATPHAAVAFLRQDYLAAARQYFSPAAAAISEWWLSRFIASTYAAYSRTLVISGYAGQCLVDLGVSPLKVRRTVQGLDQVLFRPMPAAQGEEPLRLLYVGRFAKEKNIDLLAACFAPGRHSPDKVRLHCLGDGPLLAEFRRSVDPSVVTCGGFVDGGAVVDALRHAHFLLSTCPVETFGNAMVEAMACGRPVIAIDGGAAREHVIDGETGFLFRSVEELDALIHRLGHGRSLAAAMGLRAAAYAERYTWEVAAADLLAATHGG